MSLPAAAASTMKLTPLKRRCVLILGLDGCRPDCLTRQHAPTLRSMIDGSLDGVVKGHRAAYSLRSQVGDIAWSGPGWTSAVTGVWRGKHGVGGNVFVTAQFDSYPTLFQRLKHRDAEAVTGAVVNWKPMADHVLQPADHCFVHEEDDEAVLGSSLKLLREQSRLDCLFVHFDDVDHAGHEYDYGPSVPEYVSAVTRTDARVRTLFDALTKERPREWYAEEDWLVVITTDHGGADYTHEDSRPENRTNFLILYGRDVAGGELFPPPVIVDVAPTVLAHMGIAYDFNWNLDGRPVGLCFRNRDEEEEDEATACEQTDSKIIPASVRPGHWMDFEASHDPLGRYPVLDEGDPLPLDLKQQASESPATSTSESSLMTEPSASPMPSASPLPLQPPLMEVTIRPLPMMQTSV